MFDGWPRDCRGSRKKRETPPKTEPFVARAGVIREGKLRAEAGPSGAGCDGLAHRPGASDRVGGDFLAEAANDAVALWQSDRRESRSGALIRSAALCTRRKLARRPHIESETNNI
jgi:hypothetical protein